jgi:ABC-type glycerol-3-phosphate transport system permease component
MDNKPTVKKNIKDYIYFALMFIVTIIVILPLIWLFSASVQGLSGLSKTPFDWVPHELLFRNFSHIWIEGKLGYAFLSSVCASSIYIVLHLFICTISGYVFAKYNFRFRNTIFTFILITMMVPPEITYFPVYGIMKSLHAINTYPGLVIPCMISGFGIFFMRQFAIYIPNELLECARIDGAGNLRTFFQIALPLLKSAVSALAILAFVYIWNEYAWSYLVINSDKMKTLPVTLAMMASQQFNPISYNEILAGGVIALLPVLVLFLIFQKQFIESVTNSGIKG